MGDRGKLWLSTYPVLRDDVSWLSPTDPWRQDHGIEWINFAPGGFGQFHEARYQRRCGRGLLDAVAFYRDYEGLLVFLADPRWQPEGGYYLVPDGYAYGLEVTRELPVSPRLTFVGQVVYTKSHDDATGGDIPYTPEWTARVGAHYKDAAGWRLDGTLRFTGRREHRFADGSTRRLGSYGTLDARISRQLSTTWEVFLRGSNLLDRDYDHWYGFPELGRHVAAGFEHRF